jgi:TPR repeat protein
VFETYLGLAAMCKRLKFHLPLAITLLFVFALPAYSGEKKSETYHCPSRSSAFVQMKHRAEAADQAAQAAMAECYELGRNVQPSRAETIHWLTLAANQGYAPAQYELGRIYLYGRGVPADYQQALTWEKKAADQGQSKAQRDLAFMYERGLGVQADPHEAAVWNRKAAMQGDPESQFHLGEALEKGTGVSASLAEAKLWYLKAARQDLTPAQLRAGQIYAEEGDACRALFWFQKAAENGDAQSMQESGHLYQAGKCGGDQNKAYFWLRASGRFGSAASAADADKLAGQLTPARKLSVDSQVERWVRGHSGAQKDEDEKEREER